MNEVNKKILSMLKEKKTDVVIPEDTSVNLLDSGVIDSFDIVDLIASLEEIFGIELDGDDIIPENFESVDAIAKLIAK
ncbi:MAG: acyl carrier protein [Spirochaetales bacterium]|nr:acyl carrier protein [Spirochaetales bacterium]